MCIEIGKLPKNLRVYICTHVFRGVRPISLVVHSIDGSISMLCGETDHSTDPSSSLDFYGVCLEHLLNGDPSLLDIPSLPRGFEAERMLGRVKWDLRRLPPDVE